MVGKGNKSAVIILTTRGCSFSVLKKRQLVSGLVKEHWCFCVFMLLHFTVWAAGFSRFCSVGLKCKYDDFWCETAQNGTKHSLLDSPESKCETITARNVDPSAIMFS